MVVNHLNYDYELMSFIYVCRQVDKDCDFLEQERIMDYSLLLGIHFREVSETGEPIAVEDGSSFSDVSTSNGINFILFGFKFYYIFYEFKYN